MTKAFRQPVKTNRRHKRLKQLIWSDHIQLIALYDRRLFLQAHRLAAELKAGEAGVDGPAEWYLEKMKHRPANAGIATRGFFRSLSTCHSMKPNLHTHPSRITAVADAGRDAISGPIHSTIGPLAASSRIQLKKTCKCRLCSTTVTVV